MNEQDFELVDTVVEEVEESKTPKTTKVDATGFVERGTNVRADQVKSMASVLGEFDKDVALEAIKEENSTITTLSAIERNFDSFVKFDDAGDLMLPEPPNVQNFLSQSNESTRRLYEQARKSNTAQLELITDKYKKAMRRSDMSARERLKSDISYTVGAGLAGVSDIAASGLALVGMGAGMVTQTIGNLGDSDNDNIVVDLGVLLQDLSVRYLNKYNEFVDKGLSEFDAGEIAESAGEIARTALPVGLSAVAAWLSGGAASSAVLASATSKGISKAVANRAAKMYAKRAAGRIGKNVSYAYGASSAQSYLERESEGKSSEEYQDYLRSKTGGQILSDAAWASLVGTTSYYLEKAFGAEASIQNFFGSATKGLTKTVVKRGLEESATEVLQDTSLDAADLIRGLLGNEEREVSALELMDNLISKETLKTFVISSAIGGFTGGAEYTSARSNLVKDYKARLKKVFPNATEEQLETAGKAFIKNVDDNVTNKVIQSIAADDQLKNGYGTYQKIIENRINTLINKSIAEGKELAFKDKSPEYQAQFVGSMAQRFVDEMYAQAVLRQVPVNEVFDVTKIDIESDGKSTKMYMYGADYGKRPLGQFGEMTPAEWNKMQLETQIANELQRKNKAQQEQINKALEEAKTKEKEQKIQSYRAYLAGRNFQESELTDKQAEQQARTMANQEIRNMSEDTARGILSAIREDLPAEMMNATEIRKILRSELERFMALQDKESIAPIAKMPSTKARQEQIVRRVRMAKPKSFSEYVRSAGISKDTVEKLGLAGELKKILDKNYRFFVRKNGTITNLEEFAADYQRDGDSYQGSVNGFLELLEKDLTTKDVYASDQLAEVELWRERSIRAGKEEESRLLAERDQELAESTARLQEAGYDISTMTDDDILAKGREMRAEEAARMDMIDSDINIDVDDDLVFSDSWLHSVKEANDLAEENARLDDIYPAYEGDTITVNGVERTVYNSNGDRIAKSAEALRNFWNWFGDSKVVDKDGRPLVVYHGTKEKFDTFDIKQVGSNTGNFGHIGFGFYFTQDQDYAQSYGANVMPVYLKSTNVFTGTKEQIKSVAKELNESPYTEFGDGKQLKRITDFTSIYTFGDSSVDFTNAVKKLGYDSVFDGDEYVVFESNQIKSTQNRGTFSPDTGNIYYQNVEEKDLIVQHGTTLYKLKEALELGGMPVPSLAVMKAEHSNKQYGEITFVGGRNVIEGEQVYTSDIYSTRRLKPTSVLNKKGEKKLRELVGGRMYFIAANLPDLEGTSKGEDLFMHLYLLEKGLRTDPENTLTRNSVDSIEEFGKMSETEKTDYVEWTKNFMSEYFDKKLFAGYTPSGNQRLLDYNMQNIVKLMSKEKKVASEYGAGTSAHALKGIWAKPLKTIKDIQKNKGRLVDSEAYKEADDQFWTSMRLLTDLLTTEESDKIVAQRYIANSEYVVEVLAQIKKSTNIKQLLADNKLNDSAEAVQAVKDFKTFAENVPTKYFEAKPYRAVDFKEFEAVLMPSDTEYNQAAEQLESMGLTVLRYSSEQERAEQIQTLKPIMFQTKGKSALGQRNLAAWNPLRRSIELFTGANETSIAHELSHFWLDNMMLYSRLESAARDTGFAKVWGNIKKYLNIDDRQEQINESQAEKYTSAYMQYIRNTKIAPVVDLGFKGFDEFIGDISLDYFENAKHREDDGTISSELEIITPEMVDAFQKLTTADLNQVRDLVATLQDKLPETAIDSQLGEQATPEQMKTATVKQARETQQKLADTSMKNAERDATPTDIPENSKTQQEAQNRLKSQPTSNTQYAIGTTDEESFAKARAIIAKDRAYAEEIIADDPNGITDGISNSFIALELARQAVQNGKNAMPYLESFVNGASASGASLRTANLLNTPEFAWAKDMYEASQAKNYALALRMRPAARNAILHRNRIVQTFESKLDEYVEKLFPQLEQAQTYEEQVKIINEWGNNTAKEIGVEPTSEVWGQSVKGTSAKKTEFGKKVVYQKRKLKEFLKSKIGATLTDAEQLKIRQLHTNTIDAMRQLQANPNDIETAKEFIRQARNYQDYLNALAPVGWANALFSSIPRASMLFRISTQVKNTVGTRLEILMSDLNRQLRYGKGNLISKQDMDKEIKKSVEMFLIGGFSPDVQQNFFETPVLAWGEKQYSMIARSGDRRGAVFSAERLLQDAKDVAEYAKDNWENAEGAKKVVVAGRIGIAVAERAMGKAYDVLGYSDAYMKAIIATHETAKACTFYAQAIGKEKDWTSEKIKEYANELFADARSYVPKTKLGAEIRKQAVSQAQLETFIKNGTIAEFANRVRAGINLGKESGIGTFISPYVSTAANIMQLGIDYTTGWWRRFDGWKSVKDRIYENAKQGKPIDKADMEYLEKGYRGTYGGLFLLIMLALFKGAQALTGEDDALDYVPPYSQLSARERAYYKQVNGGKYNAIKIGDIWVSAEYFGGLSNAITNIGTWYHANSIISAATGLIAETPVIGDLVEQYQKLENDIKYDKDVIDISIQATLNQAEKYIPGIGKDIYKAIDEGKVAYPLFGSSVGFTVSDEAKEVLDVQRESEATYSSISRSKPFNKLSREDKRKLDDEFNREYIAEAHRWIKLNPNATKEQQKKALDAIRKKIRNNLKVRYRNLIQ